MKVAVICPNVRVLETIHVSMHFVVASKIQSPQWYRQRSAFGDFIILDNGAPEGELVSSTVLLEIANTIRADEIILPDVLYDSETTIMMSTQKDLLKAIPEHKRMVVPQGANWDEWRHCLTELHRRCRPATIGIPKWQQRLPDGRAYAIDLIKGHREWSRCNVHLLGLARPPAIEFAQLNYPTVRSVDTALPIALAQHQRTLGPGRERVSFDWDAPYDTRIAERNIGDLLRMAAEAPLCTFL
jgi:hypothetical protein